MEDNPTISQRVEQKVFEYSLPKMKWYYFTIYFYLFLCSLLLLIMGIVMLSTDNTQVTALLVFYKIFGALTICFSIFGIVVRQMLARFRCHATVCLRIFYLYYTSIMLLTLILDISMGDINAITLLLSLHAICFNVFAIVFGYFYFKKRKFLFTGSPQTYTMLEIETEEKYRQKHPYVYGKYIGSDGWFAFLIYFWLFAIAGTLFILALVMLLIVFLSGVRNSIGAGISEYFALFAVGNIDYEFALTFATVLLLLSAFFIAVRFLLSSFKKAGVICLHCSFCAIAVLSTLQLTVLIITAAGGVQVGGTIFWTIIEWLYCVLSTVGSFIYFKRRKDFFD
ncbi:MAG: hypothetical protein K2M89_03950 [Clostridiales bacterium]|nr:hypothetical protein [Clostridiales bacterium]